MYAPSFNEIYTFFPHKISKKDLKTLLKREVQKNKLLRLPNNKQFSLPLCPTNYKLPTTNHAKYTLPQYSMHGEKNSKFKSQISNNKIGITIQKYIYLLRLCPFVQFVGVTGRSAMEGVSSNDDLDLCIVTKHSLLWTTRFYAVLCAKLLGLHTKTGVCLNLFFDEADLIIQEKKQNAYIAHELLQMKPIIDKDSTYRRFFTKNEWIYRYFPNAQSYNTKHVSCTMARNMLHVTCYMLLGLIDHLFKSIQIPIIQRNDTALFITETQLWLFKNDFEKKLKRRGLVI